MRKKRKRPSLFFNISYMYLDFLRKKRILQDNKVSILFVMNKKQKSNLMRKNNKLKYIKIAISLLKEPEFCFIWHIGSCSHHAVYVQEQYSWLQMKARKFVLVLQEFLNEEISPREHEINISVTICPQIWRFPWIDLLPASWALTHTDSQNKLTMCD